MVASGGPIGHSADAAVEYWNYLDRPETFIRFVLLHVFSINTTDIKSSIGDSEDELGRMLAVLRFWFTKDLVRCLWLWGVSRRFRGLMVKSQKYVKGKPCKPYNSTLGEFFRVRGIAW